MNSIQSPPQTRPPLLEVRDLSFRYGSRTALDGIGFTLTAGRFHALLGPNGAGKSTLFGLISRLLKNQQGRILLEGDDLCRAPARVLARIGMVFQQSSLDPDLSVNENLHYHAALHGMDRRLRRQRIEAELARVELTDRCRDRVRTLNGGHRRRVEIARALLHQPRLLLLDEATVGLDTRARSEINAHVRRLCSDRGMGVLWATHLIEEIRPQDSVTLLHRGRLLTSTSSEEICRRGGYPDLAEAFRLLTETDEVCS